MADTALGDRLERSVRQRAGRAAAIAAVNMETALRRAWAPHRKTEDTLGSISVRLTSATTTRLEYLAVATTPQARYVNDGTPAHVITPRANPSAVAGSKWPRYVVGEPLLVFDWPKGGMHPARFRWVEHPGYAGDHWWDNTIATWSDLVEEAFSRL